MRRTDRDLPPPPSKDRPNRSWVCAELGEPHACDTGPDAHGRCPLRDVCRPKRTWQGKRRPWLMCGLTLSAIIFGVALFGPINTSWVKPGELSTPHAQILSGSLESERCATCHADASTSAASWFFAADSDHAGIDQTQRCLNCHHTLAPTTLARSAHNTPPLVRDKIRLASLASASAKGHASPRVTAEAQDDIACSVCHQEHHGADANLRLVADVKCQSCHSVSFNHFATDHPDWDAWPYGRGGEISFNHSTHQYKHFPASQAKGTISGFQCNQCHEIDARQEITRTRSYEASCAACHDAALQLSSSEGVELVSLPMLPDRLAEQQQPWPAQATGFLDGSVSPLAELLMRNDPGVANALQTIPSRTFGHANMADPNDRDAALALARGAQSLLHDIAGQGQDAIIGRAQMAGMPASSLVEFVRAMPPQLVADTLQQWFSDQARATSSAPIDHDESLASPSDQLLFQNGSAKTGLLADDLLGPGDNTGSDPLLADPLFSDPLLADPLANSTASNRPASSNATLSQFDASVMIPAGGWYRDDLRMAIRYRGVAHADATLRAIVEMASQLAPSDTVRRRILELPAVNACVQCHPSSIATPSVWTSSRQVGRTDEFTKFSHAPHVNIAKLADCKHCHTVAPLSGASVPTNPVARLDVSPASLVSFSNQLSGDHENSAHSFDFAPLSRVTCVGCHTPELTNDSCTTCHRYHLR